MASSGPLIRCTPATDQTFLRCVSSAYDRAAETRLGELAIAVMTLVQVRREYPEASIFVMAQPSGARRPLMVWLVSREAWSEVRLDRHGRSRRRSPRTVSEAG